MWQASKFDAETDKDRPVVGSVITYAGQKWRVKEVGWSAMSALLKEHLAGVTDSKIMDKKSYTACIARDHKTRPGVVWLVWADPEEEACG